MQEVLDEALRLEHALKMLETERTVVVLHYAPIADDRGRRARGDLPVPRLLAAGRDHRPLRGVRAVFHGHAHHGSYAGQTRRGIPVFNVAAPVAKPNGKAYALIEV